MVTQPPTSALPFCHLDWLANWARLVGIRLYGAVRLVILLLA
jgi:hypothetical protein